MYMFVPIKEVEIPQWLGLVCACVKTCECMRVHAWMIMHYHVERRGGG